MYTANQADGCNVMFSDVSAQTKVLNIELHYSETILLPNPFVNRFKTLEKEKP